MATLWQILRRNVPHPEPANIKRENRTKLPSLGFALLWSGSGSSGTNKNRLNWSRQLTTGFCQFDWTHDLLSYTLGTLTFVLSARVELDCEACPMLCIKIWSQIEESLLVSCERIRITVNWVLSCLKRWKSFFVALNGPRWIEPTKQRWCCLVLPPKKDIQLFAYLSCSGANIWAVVFHGSSTGELMSEIQS